MNLKSLFVNEVAAWPEDEPIKQWCRSRYGGVLYQEGDLIGAFKEFAQVYNLSPRCRWAAHHRLHQVLGKDPEVGLKALDHPELTESERRAVQSILNEFNPDLEAVLLTVRDEGWALPINVNHRLAGFLNNESYHRLYQPATSPPEARSGLEAILLDLASSQADKPLWLLAAANMAILRGDSKEAGRILSEADQADRKREYEAQLIVLQALLKRAYLEPLDAQGEAELLIHLLRLKERANVYRNGNQGRSNSIYAALSAIFQSVLEGRYLAENRDARAVLSMAALRQLPHGYRTDAYISGSPLWMLIQAPPDQLRALADVLKQPQTPYEDYLVKAWGWTADYPLEIAGSYYIRTHRFEEAIEVLSDIPQDKQRLWTEGSSGWERWRWNGENSTAGAHNPFQDNPYLIAVNKEFTISHEAMFKEARRLGLSGHSQDNIVRLTAAPRTRLDFARKMKQLQDLGRQNGELGALSLFYYGQALYNISWYGRSWRMSAWGRSIYERMYLDKLPARNNYPYYWLYNQMHRYAAIDPEDQYHYPVAAGEALNQALLKTRNPELKARLKIMLADMSGNDRRWWSDYAGQDRDSQRALDEQLDQKRRDHLRDLAVHYKDTIFFEEARQACPLLEDFQ